MVKAPATKVTTVELPAELLREARKQAIDEGTTFRALVQRLLEQHLADVQKRGGKCHG